MFNGGGHRAWWETRLGYYEMIVDFGKIQHPRELNFSTMYADEFVPEMRLLGYDWKVPNVQYEECDDVDGEGAGVEDVSKGSRATWYKGRNRALQTLAERHIGAGAKPFAFKSAANHSAYKECSKCQSNRLSVQEAIQQKMSRDVIMKRKELQAAHLQVMYTAAMDSYRIAMDSYQLIAPSIKMFDSYPDSYHKDAFDSYHRDSLDSYHRGHHRDTLNHTKYA